MTRQTLMTIAAAQASTASQLIVHPDASTTTTNVGRSGMPAAIPSEQRYYWTQQWQDDEAASRQDLAEGQSRTFSSVTDALEWLRKED